MIAVLMMAPLFTACGGAASEDLNARQREEAAAMQRAVQLAGEANAGAVRTERAKAAAKASP